jgi:hypothetical protein
MPETLPEIPLFEDPRVEIPPHPDPLIDRFVRDMGEYGGAVLDLGPEAAALCDRAVADTDPYFRKGVVRVQDTWRKSDAVRRLALLPRVHEALFAAYGRKSFAFQTLNFRKGSQQELHSDMIHFSSLPERFMCGVWIALEDVLPGSGPLTYYPGSHRLGPLTMAEAGVEGRASRVADYERYFVPKFAERVAASGLPRRELLIPKGWAFVWAANLAHGGSPITAPGSTRRSLVVHCYFDEGLYYTPMTSDEQRGRLSVRLPPDVGGGWWRWPRHSGGRTDVRLRTLIAAVRRELSNKAHVFF